MGDAMHRRQRAVSKLKDAVARRGVEAGENPVGREDQFNTMQKHIARCFVDTKGCVIYVTGISGTGKSMTVHAVLASQWRFPIPFEAPPALVSINCMSLSGPKAVFEAIWTGYEQHCLLEDPSEIAYPCQTSGKSIGVTKADEMKAEIAAFIQTDVPKGKFASAEKPGKKRSKRTKHQSDRSMLIVFLDEIDHLITRNVELLLELFSMAESSQRLILIGAANTLDLTNRWMKDLEDANCVPKLIPFPAYRSNEVTDVLEKCVRRHDVDNIFTTRAIDFLARKACSAGKGDMRAVFPICLSALSALEKEESYGAFVDVKEIMGVFKTLNTEPEEEPYTALSSVPLDQKVLLWAVTQLAQQSIRDSAQSSSDNPPRKKSAPSKGTRSDEWDLSAIFQQYVSACKTLCLDASSRAEVFNLAMMLCDTGLLATERPKKGKRFRLTLALATMLQFFEQSRLFAGTRDG